MGYSPRPRYATADDLSRTFDTERQARRRGGGGPVVEVGVLTCRGGGEERLVAAWCREPGIPHEPHRRPLPTPPGRSPWESHTAHDAVPVTRLLDDALVAWLCSCGAQLPPRLERDPDGRIVGASWDLVPHPGCYRCGALLDWWTLTVDRIVPGCVRTAAFPRGGTYVRSNVRPARAGRNSSTGAALSKRGPEAVVLAALRGRWPVR